MATVKAHCNKCMRQTNHETLHIENTNWDDILDEDTGQRIGGGDTYEFLKCRGCDGFTFRHSHWFSEETDDKGHPITHVDYYPPAISRRKPEWYNELIWHVNIDSPLRHLLEEIYTALYSDSRIIAAMGIRAVIDIIMIEKVGDSRTFQEKLTKFKDAEFISGKQMSFLKETIDIGNQSAHRGFSPSMQDISTLLDITETLIETVYVHENRVKNLKKPKR